MKMQQAAFEPNNIRAGHWAEPGQDSAGPRVLLRRRTGGRVGVNYKQIPVNSPKVEVHSYSKDGVMRIRKG